MRWAWSSDWRKFYGHNPYPYDLGYVEARDGSEQEYRMVVKAAGPPPGILIDLGCGYGRHIVELARAGYHVVGTDVSTECIRRASERPGAHQAVCAANERLPFPNQVFDGVFSVYSSIGYAGTCTRRILTEAYRVTRSGGWLLVDVSHQPYRSISWGWEQVPGGSAAWVKRVSKRWVRQRNFVASRSVTGQYGFNIERHTKSSLQQHANLAGWTNCRFYGDHALAPLTATSRRLVMVACRPS